MRFTKRNLIKTAAAGSVFIGALAVAAPASAESFGPTDYGAINQAVVSYNDQNDDFCVRATQSGGATFTVSPYDSRRGPNFKMFVPYGQTKCVGLQRAFEDSAYYYQISAGGFFFGITGETGPKVSFSS